MNVQMIFQALNGDQDNSALGIICRELKSQGYTVMIDGVKVTSEGELPQIKCYRRVL
jgi:hypothetical protein